jgi:hypothetical protein
MPPTTAQKRGRPSKGIGQFKPVHLYLAPDTIRRLDRLVDQEIQRTGHTISRMELLRTAVQEYLERREPPQRLRTPARGDTPS